MKLSRRQFLHLAAGAAALPVASRFAVAQAYPTRPVRVIVGFTPGGAPDILARLMQHGVAGQRNHAARFRRVVQDDGQYRHDHVPYRGGSQLITDLIAGQVQVTFIGLVVAIEHIRSGKLRALAVTTATRSDVLPDIPTVGDFVPGYEASAWFGVGAEKDTPAEIVDKLNGEINAGLADPKIKARLADLGGTPLVVSPADFGRLIADETEKWGKVIKFAGIKKPE